MDESCKRKRHVVPYRSIAAKDTLKVAVIDIEQEHSPGRHVESKLQPDKGRAQRKKKSVAVNSTTPNLDCIFFSVRRYDMQQLFIGCLERSLQYFEEPIK